MRRNRSEAKNVQATPRELLEHRSAGGEHQREHFSAPESLNHVFDESPNHLAPGDVIVLNESQALRSEVELDFFAVLACPRCGILNLVTASQYFGASPVICGSNSCSCNFRIEDESRIVYLPVN